jgi:hypothetical protein
VNSFWFRIHSSVLLPQEAVLKELVDNGKDHGVGGGLDGEARPGGQAQKDARGQNKEENGGREQVHPHFVYLRRKKPIWSERTPSDRVRPFECHPGSACLQTPLCHSRGASSFFQFQATT